MPSHELNDDYTSEFLIAHGDEGLNGRLALDGKLDECVKFMPNPGTVMQLTENQTFRTGVHENIPAMFLSNVCSFAKSDADKSSASQLFLASTATTNAATVCIGSRSYIVETSAFVPAKYVFGEPLTAISNDRDSTVGGKLTNSGSGKNGKVKKYRDPVVGVVTALPSKNHDGLETMQVLTGWLPAGAKN